MKELELFQYQTWSQMGRNYYLHPVSYKCLRLNLWWQWENRCWLSPPSASSRLATRFFFPESLFWSPSINPCCKSLAWLPYSSQWLLPSVKIFWICWFFDFPPSFTWAKGKKSRVRVRKYHVAKLTRREHSTNYNGPCIDSYWDALKIMFWFS